jgi:dihydrofolate reductase
MGKVILGLTISLDGFAEDLHRNVKSLYPDLDALRETDAMKKSISSTGAVVMSRKEFSMIEDPDTIADNYEYQVPIFVYTDKAPEKHPKENDKVTFTFVTGGISSAVQQAKEAAGDKDVTIIGSALSARHCLNESLADELHLDVIPVFLKTGFRPFDGIDTETTSVERMDAEELPEGRTRIRYRFVK